MKPRADITKTGVLVALRTDILQKIFLNIFHDIVSLFLEKMASTHPHVIVGRSSTDRFVLVRSI